MQRNRFVQFVCWFVFDGGGEGMWDRDGAKEPMGKGLRTCTSKLTEGCLVGSVGVVSPSPSLGVEFTLKKGNRDTNLRTFKSQDRRWLCGFRGMLDPQKPWSWGLVARFAKKGEDDPEGHLCGSHSPTGRREVTHTGWAIVSLELFVSSKPDN